MPNDTIVDIYCHIIPEKFFQEMNRIAPRLGNIAARLRGVKKLFDLDERFREMDQFGDYRQIISLPNPPIEDLAVGHGGPRPGAHRQRRHGGTVRAPSQTLSRPSSQRCR